MKCRLFGHKHPYKRWSPHSVRCERCGVCVDCGLPFQKCMFKRFEEWKALQR
jgi:hypothetical protein